MLCTFHTFRILHFPINYTQVAPSTLCLQNYPLCYSQMLLIMPLILLYYSLTNNSLRNQYQPKNELVSPTYCAVTSLLSRFVISFWAGLLCTRHHCSSPHTCTYHLITVHVYKRLSSKAFLLFWHNSKVAYYAQKKCWHNVEGPIHETFWNQDTSLIRTPLLLLMHVCEIPE